VEYQISGFSATRGKSIKKGDTTKVKSHSRAIQSQLNVNINVQPGLLEHHRKDQKSSSTVQKLIHRGSRMREGGSRAREGEFYNREKLSCRGRRGSDKASEGFGDLHRAYISNEEQQKHSKGRKKKGNQLALNKSLISQKKERGRKPQSNEKTYARHYHHRKRR